MSGTPMASIINALVALRDLVFLLEFLSEEPGELLEHLIALGAAGAVIDDDDAGLHGCIIETRSTASTAYCGAARAVGVASSVIGLPSRRICSLMVLPGMA